jgi:pSer/pThr/pTyr-binding forkhead associated (FHA) protein
MDTISRQHARIECKGNRFRIIDVSTNGTYINGKRIADVYLRDGDVITFSEKGPKASFLTKIGAGSTSTALPHSEITTSKSSGSSLVSPPAPGLTLGADQEVQVLSADAPLVIQYGQTMQSFNLLPITIGSSHECDFVIAERMVDNHHLQIFFSDGNYYAKKLTGKGKVTVNGRAIETQSVLARGAVLALCDQGPKFTFLGDGRLAEIQDVGLEQKENTNSVSNSEELLKKTSIWQKISKALTDRLFKRR